MKLTAAVITYNEEKNIRDCLKSVDWADQKIVIDSQSKDNTSHIAKALGAEVYSITFSNFSNMRNLAHTKAKGDWILYIDADERVTPELASQIRISIQQKDYSAYTLRRKNYYLGQPWPFTEDITRLFNRKKLQGWYGKVHESPKVEGAIGQLSEFLLHYTHRDLSSMVEKTNNWSDVEAQLRYTNSHPPIAWWRFIRVMITSFWEYFIVQKGFKAGTVGLIESIYQSYSIFITYAKLYELQKRNQKTI